MVDDGCGVHEGKLSFGFGDNDVKGQFDDFVQVKQFPFIKVKHEEPVIGEERDALLLFLANTIVIDLIFNFLFYDCCPQFFLGIVLLHGNVWFDLIIIINNKQS
jgi:hypothetical protein